MAERQEVKQEKPKRKHQDTRMDLSGEDPEAVLREVLKIKPEEGGEGRQERQDEAG